LTEQLNDYLDYVADKWLEENTIAVESNLRNELVENFIVGLKGLFEENYIDVPEDKVDVLEQLFSEKEELETKFNELVSEHIELKKILEEAAKNEVFDTVKEGLTLTQLEKFKTLAEGIEFSDLDTYKSKLEIVKENYFVKTTKSDTGVVDDKVEEQINETVKYVDPSIAQFAKAITRSR
jgi:ribosomal protein L16 Arg81 hydroxylase